MMRATKRLGVTAVLLLLALVGAVGLRAFLTRGRPTPGTSGRAYRVQYVWDHGIRSLRIADAKTGMEESDPKWRARVGDEAAKDIANLARLEGLTRATGTLFITFLGDGEPYLPVVNSTTEDVDAIKDPDVTPLMCAINRDDVAKARELITAGGRVNAADQHGWTALMGAAGRGDVAIVKALLAAGADVNARNRDGETALIAGAFAANLGIVEELVRHGADVNVSSRYGVTPLMEAARRGGVAERESGRPPTLTCATLVRILIAKGAKVNDHDVLGETPLMLATSCGCLDAVRALVKAGADVNARSGQGQTALLIAKAAGDRRMARLLSQAGATE